MSKSSGVPKVVGIEASSRDYTWELWVRFDDGHQALILPASKNLQVEGLKTFCLQLDGRDVFVYDSPLWTAAGLRSNGVAPGYTVKQASRYLDATYRYVRDAVFGDQPATNATEAADQTRTTMLRVAWRALQDVWIDMLWLREGRLTRDPDTALPALLTSSTSQFRNRPPTPRQEPTAVRADRSLPSPVQPATAPLVYGAPPSGLPEAAQRDPLALPAPSAYSRTLGRFFLYGGPNGGPPYAADGSIEPRCLTDLAFNGPVVDAIGSALLNDAMAALRRGPDGDRAVAQLVISMGVIMMQVADASLGGQMTFGAASQRLSQAWGWGVIVSDQLRHLDNFPLGPETEGALSWLIRSTGMDARGAAMCADVHRQIAAGTESAAAQAVDIAVGFQEYVRVVADARLRQGADALGVRDLVLRGETWAQAMASPADNILKESSAVGSLVGTSVVIHRLAAQLDARVNASSGQSTDIQMIG